MAGATDRAIDQAASQSCDRGGYVLDNMEGAVDRAAFFAKTDLPIAVIGARGTGKMYVARVVHEESGGGPDGLLAIDCREFRNRESANRRIDRALRSCRGKTLVFKYPHLMCADAQLRLARQLSTRTLLDTQPLRTLPRGKFVALFPESIERLVRKQQLTERLASVFGGYPIFVPPIRDRQRAVLRWADKILAQECEDRGIALLRFTPDAEQAMLAHSWEGNISEMRQRIVHAFERIDGEWVNAVDLGLFAPLQPVEAPVVQPVLDGFGGEPAGSADYEPSAVEELEQRIAEAVHHVLSTPDEQPLGTWLEDEVILAVLDCFNGHFARAARHLGTTSRNIQRWLPGIESRQSAREDSMHWKSLGELVKRWVSDTNCGQDPLNRAREIVLSQLESQGMDVSLKVRAAVLGVSVPTYNKRLRQASETAE